MIVRATENPPQRAAVQWLGNNKGEVDGLIGERSTRDGTALVSTFLAGSHNVPLDGWVVVGPESMVTAYSDLEFNAKFTVP